MDKEAQQKVVWAFLDFLERVSQQGDGPEEIEVAHSLLSTAFGLDRSDEAQKQTLSVSCPLEKLVEGTTSPMANLSSSFTAAAPPPPPPTPPQSSHAANTATTGVQETPKFEEFKAKLEQMGFFSGTEEGSEEYKKRFAMAQAKFEEAKSQLHPSTPAPVSEDAKQRAKEWKEQGNEKLQLHLFEDAVNCYTQAIDLDPSCAVYFSNRAAAYIHLNKLTLAREDCEHATKLDPSFARAHGRLGSINMQQGEYQQAQNAYTKALDLDPNNETYRKQLEEVNARLSSSQSQQNPFSGFGMGPGGVPDLSNMMSAMQASGIDFGSMAQQMLNNPEMMNAAMQMGAQMFGNMGGNQEGNSGNSDGTNSDKKDQGGNGSNMYS